MPIGVWHLLANLGTSEVRWLSVNTPRRRAPSRSAAGHVLPARPAGPAIFADRAAADVRRSRRSAASGITTGTPPQAEALPVEGPARGRGPAGMDTALLAYNGISVQMLVDRVFGADHLTMFTVDYEVGGAAPAHNHPFEEAYVILVGRGRGGVRRGDQAAAAGRRRLRRGRGRATGSTTTGRSGSAGSRRRRPSRRPATPIAGTRSGRGSTRDRAVGSCSPLTIGAFRRGVVQRH